MVVLAPPARRRCDSRCGDPTPSREPLSVGVPEATLMAVAARAQSPGAVWFPGAVAMAPHELESPGSAPRQLRAGFGGGTLSAHQPGAGSENSAPRPVPGVAAEPPQPGDGGTPVGPWVRCLGWRWYTVHFVLAASCHLEPFPQGNTTNSEFSPWLF